MGEMQARIEEKLREALAPARLEIEDQSHLHAGHVGARPEGETHFKVVAVSAAFEGLSRVERHRLVNRCLAEELSARIHALSLSLKAPSEVVDSP